MGGMVAVPEELWNFDDGAPDGVPFDLVVPSISRHGEGYRIVRDEISRCIVHRPRCKAWRLGGPSKCRHVARALDVAEEPLRTLAIDIVEAWQAGGWRPGTPREEYGAAVYRSALEACAQMDRIDAWEGRQGRTLPTAAEVFELFGPKPRVDGPGLAGLLAPRVPGRIPTNPLASDQARDAAEAAEGIRIYEEATGREVTR